MFDDRTSQNDPGVQQRPPGDGIQMPKKQVPVFTLVAWAGVIAAVAVLFLNKQHPNASAAPISQAEFLDKLDSNQIASATVEVNQQTMPLAEVTGTFYEVDKDGKVTSTEIPFTVHNFFLTGVVENKLVHSRYVSFSASNTVLMNLLWSITPFLILGVLFWFFFIRQIKARRTGA